MMRLLLFVVCLAAALPAADLAGSWRFYFVNFGEGQSPARLGFQLKGDQVTGNINEIKIEGTFRDGALHLTGKRPNGQEIGKLEGHFKGDELAGTAHLGNEDRAWVARRATKPTAAPQTHNFEPTQFHRYFS